MPKQVEKTISNLPELLEGYEAWDIYNADETGLFFSCLPDRMLAPTKEEKV
jgi:hypothetical protein